VLPDKVQFMFAEIDKRAEMLEDKKIELQRKLHIKQNLREIMARHEDARF
jgi:hypothetical protein